MRKYLQTINFIYQGVDIQNKEIWYQQTEEHPFQVGSMLRETQNEEILKSSHHHQVPGVPGHDTNLEISRKMGS